MKAFYKASDRPQVCQCGSEDVDLHHLTYERIGAEEMEDLVALCRTCHQDVHVLEARGDIGLDLSGIESEERAARYLADSASSRADANAATVHREVLKQGRQLRDKLKRVAGRASEQGVDIRDELRAVSEALDAAEARLK
jgi:hypothetical protein